MSRTSSALYERNADFQLVSLWDHFYLGWQLAQWWQHVTNLIHLKYFTFIKVLVALLMFGLELLMLSSLAYAWQRALLSALLGKCCIRSSETEAHSVLTLYRCGFVFWLLGQKWMSSFTKAFFFFFKLSRQTNSDLHYRPQSEYQQVIKNKWLN